MWIVQGQYLCKLNWNCVRTLLLCYKIQNATKSSAGLVDILNVSMCTGFYTHICLCVTFDLPRRLMDMFPVPEQCRSL